MHTVQGGHRTMVRTLCAKVDILFNYWAKIMWLLQLRAAQLKDQETTDLVMQFGKVPEPVKRAVFGDYLLRCRNYHGIAFLQWRELYPSTAQSLANHESNHIKDLI